MNEKKTFIRDFSFRINDTSFKKSFVAQKNGHPAGGRDSGVPGP